MTATEAFWLVVVILLSLGAGFILGVLWAQSVEKTPQDSGQSTEHCEYGTPELQCDQPAHHDIMKPHHLIPKE